ncbi:imidazole glycerol phosphate synthase subunit HisH [Lachnospiraceae bacterium 62-35]
MIALIDYDAGNLKSVEKALKALGETPKITRNRKEILEADKVILPGVGAFGDAMEKLGQYGLIPVIHEVVEQGLPLMGICLGLQLMFESSEEQPGVQGLSLFPGRILKIPHCPGLKIPHMGWNSLDIAAQNPILGGNRGRLFQGIEQGSYVYFVHSYYLKAEDESIVAASTEYGTHIHAAVEKDNVFACQFHPEKSGKTGLRILKNFIELT